MDRITSNRSDSPDNSSSRTDSGYQFANFSADLRTISGKPLEQRQRELHTLVNRLPVLPFDDRAEAATQLIAQTFVTDPDAQMTIIAEVLETIEQSLDGKKLALMESTGASLESAIEEAIRAARPPAATVFAIYSQLLKLADRHDLPELEARIALRLCRRMANAPLLQRVEQARTLISMIIEFHPERRPTLFVELINHLPEDLSDRRAILEMLDTQSPLLPPAHPDSMAIQAKLAQLLYEVRLQTAAQEPAKRPADQ